jgi:hypothetical protein
MGTSPKRHKCADDDADCGVTGKPAAVIAHSSLPASKRPKNFVVRRTASSGQANACMGRVSRNKLQGCTWLVPADRIDTNGKHSAQAPAGGINANAKLSTPGTGIRTDTDETAQIKKHSDMDQSHASSTSHSVPAVSAAGERNHNASGPRTDSGNQSSGQEASQPLNNASVEDNVQNDSLGTATTVQHEPSGGRGAKTLTCEELVVSKQCSVTTSKVGQHQSAGKKTSTAAPVEGLRASSVVDTGYAPIACHTPQAKSKDDASEQTCQSKLGSQNATLNRSVASEVENQQNKSLQESCCGERSASEVSVYLYQMPCATAQDHGDDRQAVNHGQLVDGQERKQNLQTVAVANPIEFACDISTNASDSHASSARELDEHTEQCAPNAEEQQQAMQAVGMTKGASQTDKGNEERCHACQTGVDTSRSKQKAGDASVVSGVLLMP